MVELIKKYKENASIIFALAVPVIIENILQTLLGTVDTYFAGQISDNAIAAIGVTSLIINVFIAFFTAVSIGTSAVVSRNYGRKNYEGVNDAVNQSIILGGVLGFATGVINLIFYKPILNVSGAESNLINYAVPYFMIVAVPVVFLSLTLVLSSCLRSTKDTKTPMFATGIANVINIILNILFMKLGLGIFGLGLATTVSRLINMLILAYTLYRRKEFSISYGKIKVKKEILFNILKIGLPAGIEKLIMRIGQLVYNGMIISIGLAAYVAHNIAGNIESYAYIPAMGLGVATAALVGITLGENDIKKAKDLVFLSDLIATAIMVFIGIIFFIFAPYFASSFTNTEEVQSQVVMVLRLIAFFQPFAALTQIFTSALQGAGDTKFPMYATLIGIWVGRVGLGYLLGVVLELGLLGVWFGYASDITFRGIILYMRFKKGKWQDIRI